MTLNVTFLRNLFFIGCLLIGGFTFAQTGWQPLGPDDFNQPYAGSASYATSARHPITGDIYLSYSAFVSWDTGEGFVRKFNIETGLWENVGGTFCEGAAHNHSLAFSSTGTLYVGYEDSANDGKATVKKFNTETNVWEAVGTPGISNGMAQVTSLAIGADDTLYICYSDSAFSGSAVVKKFNGTQWVYVGMAGFTSVAASSPSLAVAADGTLYVSFAAYYNGMMKVTVMKYNGTAWQVMGTAGFSDSEQNTKIAVNPVTNVPYVAYSAFSTGYAANVRKFNGTEWEFVGAAGFTSDYASKPYLVISSDGTPFVGYAGLTIGYNTANMMKFNGSAWETVGNQGFSVGAAYFTNVVLDGNTPYMSYTDFYNNGKPTLMKYDGTVWKCLGGTMGISEEAIYLPYISGGKVSDIVITAEGTPYLGYFEVSNDDLLNSIPITVKKYNFGSGMWEVAGAPGFASGGGNLSMATYQNTPYISYILSQSPYNIVVMKYNGSVWENVGQSISPPNGAFENDLAIAPNGTPYVIFKDNAEKATVMKFNGTAWVLVGPAGFNTGTTYYPSIAIDQQGVPYAAFMVVSTNGENVSNAVKRFNGNSWQTIGGQIGSTYAGDLTIGPDGSIYVACQDGSGHGIIKKYNGTSWQAVGGAAFSEGMAVNISLAIKSDGQLYVSFLDYENQMNATVMRYNGISWVSVGEPAIAAPGPTDINMALSPDGQNAIISYGSPCMYARMYDVTCTTTAPLAANQTFCGTTTIDALTAEGENIRWYAVEHFGAPLASGTPLVSGTYYVAQMQNDCEGPRAAVNVIVNTVAPIVTAQTLCNGADVSALVAEGENLQWYADEAAVDSLTPETLLASGTYYVSQTQNSCESTKVAVDVVINTIMIPGGASSQVITADTPANATIGDLIVTGDNIQWYNEEGALLPVATQLESGATYFATQTIDGCESDALGVTVEVLLGFASFNANEFSYYPNPVADKLRIVSASNIISVEVYTLYGQRITNQEWNSAEGSLDMSGLSQSSYLVYLYTEKGSKSFIVTKEQ